MATQSFIRPDDFWRTLGLRGGQVVVHLGCGAGFYIIPAAKIVGREGQVIGVDILADMLSEVASKAKRESLSKIVKTVRANVENERGSTLPDGLADWVLVANVLHQSDPVKILAEAARIVKPNGSIVVIDWDTAATPFGPPSEHRLSETQAQHLVAQAKLVIKHRFTPSPYHYGLVLQHA